MNKENKLPYVGYVASFLGGNFLAPLVGIGTKLGQDSDIVQPNKNVDYVRLGALAYVTIDCLLGLGGTFHSTKEFWETSADVITMLSLYDDFKNYAVMKNPFK